MDPDSDQDDHGSRENRRHQVIGHMTPLRSEASRSSHLATLSGGGGALMKGGPRWPEGARRRPPTSDGIPVMSQERSGVGGGRRLTTWKRDIKERDSSEGEGWFLQDHNGCTAGTRTGNVRPETATGRRDKHYGNSEGSRVGRNNGSTPEKRCRSVSKDIL